jgi:hypothetical protein
MGKELRQRPRIDFGKGIGVHIMGIDGTWRRHCAMLDISESGVMLQIDGSIAGLDLKEFFLLLSSTGLAYRRCELVRVNGNQIGARFLKTVLKKKVGSPRDRRQQLAESDH